MNLSTNNPISNNRRIDELDLFRGFAIFGIFMVNILVMNVSFSFRFAWEAEQTGWVQQLSLFFLETFFYGKFFTIFSFLFGIGVALQIQQAKNKEVYSNTFFFRRFGSLFLFGVLHILFIWSGDILHLYGMLGFILLFLFRFSAKTLLWLAVVIFLFPLYSMIFEYVMGLLSLDYSGSLSALTRQEIIEIKHHGSYLSGMILRLKEYAFAIRIIYAGITPVSLSMMLLGGYIVKKGWLINLYDRIINIAPYLYGALLFLVAYRFLMLYWIMPSFDIPKGSALSIALVTIYIFSDIIISLSMLVLIGYLWNKGFLRHLLSPLCYVGRMAFSNYIFQSIIGYLIMRTFNGYEYFSAFGCILLVIGVFIFQVVLSKIWLNHFRYGPLEWLWRCISYFKYLPIRIRSNKVSN